MACGVICRGMHLALLGLHLHGSWTVVDETGCRLVLVGGNGSRAGVLDGAEGSHGRVTFHDEGIRGAMCVGPGWGLRGALPSSRSVPSDENVLWEGATLSAPCQ